MADVAATEPEDYVIATGITTSVRDFVKMAFREAGIELEFRGNDEKEKGYVTGYQSGCDAGKRKRSGSRRYQILPSYRS